MSDGRISIVTLARTGVNVDLNTLDPSLPDDAFTLAQNAFHDPTLGHGGAIRKRPGLRQFNLINAGGPILGGIPMAVAGTGGAPTTGGGGMTTVDDLPPVGAGNATGTPGGTADGGPVIVPSAGAALFNAGTPLFSGARLVVMGADNDIAGYGRGKGWMVSSKGLANAGQLQTATPPATPGMVFFYPPTSLFRSAGGRPYVFDADSRWLYYAGAHDQHAGTQATIYKTNGASSMLVAAIPMQTAASALVSVGNPIARSAITWMCKGPFNLIYIAVKDKADTGIIGETAAGNVGRAFQLDTSTGQLTLLDVFTTDAAVALARFVSQIPYCACYFDANHAGAVYYGLFNLVAGTPPLNGAALIFANNGAGAVQDLSTTDGQVVTSMLAFPPADTHNQILFAGLGINQTSPTFAKIYMRQRVALVTAGAWSAQAPITGTSDVNGKAAQNGNYWVSMVEFNGKIYASWYGVNACAIYEFAPNLPNTTLAHDGMWDGAGTWTQRYMTDTAGAIVPYYLFVDSGVLYAFGGSPESSTSIHARVTTDGVTWTDKSSQLSGLGYYAIPIFAGFDQ